VWFPVMKTPSHSGDRKALVSAFRASMGDLPAIEWGRLRIRHRRKLRQRTTGHECLLPERCARAAYGSPKDGGRSAPVIGEISGDAGFRRPAVRERHG